MKPTRRLLTPYVVLVAAAGAAALAAFITRPDPGLAWGHPGAYLMLAGLMVLGELYPVWFTSARAARAVTLTLPFIFALMLGFGVAAAGSALVLATIVADSARRRPPLRTLFNAGQYALSVAAAGATLELLTTTPQAPDPDLSMLGYAALFAASAVFTLVNHVLTSAAFALESGRRPERSALRFFARETLTSTIIVAWAPVLLVAGLRNPLTVPALMIPVIAVQRAARLSWEKVHQAHHDALTGLPNRLLFQQSVGEALAARPQGRRTAVLLFDLDHFKEVNDTLGHGTGDELLQEVGVRLVGVLGPYGTVARLGGDEFAAVLADVHDADEAVAAAEAAVTTLVERYPVKDFTLSVGASVGVALAPDHGEDTETLIRCADVAMYLAKERRATAELYDPERDQHTRRRLALVNELGNALATRQLVLHYQPIADLKRNAIMGVEALVRWQHPALGLLSPAEFIPLAERTTHIVALTRYVLDAAVAQCRAWRSEGFDLRIAVNIPAQILADAAFPDFVAHTLASHALPADALELELTESGVMGDPDGGQAVLGRLADMGVHLAIDDFGTGYSSLTYLRQLPVGTLKIDRSFVMNMVGEPENALIVRSTIQLAHSLGRETVSEGVEDTTTWGVLAGLGCDRAQGYLLSRPKPANELTPWFRELGPALRIPQLPETAEKAGRVVAMKGRGA